MPSVWSFLNGLLCSVVLLRSLATVHVFLVMFVLFVLLLLRACICDDELSDGWRWSVAHQVVHLRSALSVAPSRTISDYGVASKHVSTHRLVRKQKTKENWRNNECFNVIWQERREKIRYAARNWWDVKRKKKQTSNMRRNEEEKKKRYTFKRIKKSNIPFTENTIKMFFFLLFGCDRTAQGIRFW